MLNRLNLYNAFLVIPTTQSDLHWSHIHTQMLKHSLTNTSECDRRKVEWNPQSSKCRIIIYPLSHSLSNGWCSPWKAAIRAISFVNSRDMGQGFPAPLIKHRIAEVN
ncbi:hypothetical protein CHARACLAT_030734 [Characodon lateralis]|uniref:Uncharacterized protein n=1 Tax=Characodon lateralis TaxID=208331 RepID=A0ABU7DLA9_9TELE|nr:hypothetical protein [Characodon lateralis]